MNSSRRFELQEKRSGQERLFERLFMLGLSLGPVYLFPSGLPQVSDWLLAVWAGVTLLTRAGTARRVLNFGPMFFGALLTTYIILVNVVWALYLGDVRVAYNSLFTSLTSWLCGRCPRRFETLENNGGQYCPRAGNHRRSPLGDVCPSI